MILCLSKISRKSQLFVLRTRTDPRDRSDTSKARAGMVMLKKKKLIANINMLMITKEKLIISDKFCFKSKYNGLNFSYVC